MNDSLEKADVISQLYTIGSTKSQIDRLMSEAHSLNDSVDEEKESNLDKTANDLVAFQARCKAPKAFPQHPISRAKTEVSLGKVEKKFSAKNIINGVLLGFATIAFFVLFVASSAAGIFGDFLESISTIGTLGCAAGWFVYGKNVVAAVLDFVNENKTYKAELKKISEYVDKMNLDAFTGEWATFDNAFNECVEKCRTEHDKAIERLAQMDEKVVKKALNRLEVIESKVHALETELSEYDVIHPAYFDLAYEIARVLETGRASELPSAINIALEDKRLNDEENARRAEAERREAILEQQARDNRMHNAAMQRAAEEEARATRAHNAAMERAAEAQAKAAVAQAKEAAKQSEIAQKQARDAERAASARCAGCANRAKCSYTAKQNAGACGAYRPR